MKAIIKNLTEFGGVYSDDYIESYPELFIDCEFTEVLPSESIVKKIWNGSIWIEGLTTQELEDYNSLETQKSLKELEEKIIEKYNYLMMRALSSSMQKYGSYEYLQNQKSEYDEKYLVAKGLKVSIPLTSSLQKEMDRDFTDASLIATLEYFGITPVVDKLENFYKLIIFKYEYAENRYEIFKAFCVDYRTKCRTFLELNQLDKLNQAFAMADNLSETITDLEIETLYNEFDAL